MFVYARRLAERIPDPPLAASTRKVMWRYVISYSVLIVSVGLILLLEASGGSSSSAGVIWMIGPAILICFALLSLVVFALRTLVLLFKYRNRFAMAIEEARNPSPAAPGPSSPDTPWVS